MKPRVQLSRHNEAIQVYRDGVGRHGQAGGGGQADIVRELVSS